MPTGSLQQAAGEKLLAGFSLLDILGLWGELADGDDMKCIQGFYGEGGELRVEGTFKLYVIPSVL